jgi:hypothetical protein
MTRIHALGVGTPTPTPELLEIRAGEAPSPE